MVIKTGMHARWSALPPRDREAEEAARERLYTLAEVTAGLQDILDEEQDAHQRELVRLRMQVVALESGKWQPRGGGAAQMFIGMPVVSKSERAAEASWRGRVLAELEESLRG